MQNEMNKQELLSFLRQIERRYGITSLFFDGPTRSNTSYVMAEFAESKSGGIPSHLIGTREVSWIVCLSWMYDRFVMNAFQLKERDIDLVKNVLMGYRARALDKSGFSDRKMCKPLSNSFPLTKMDLSLIFVCLRSMDDDQVLRHFRGSLFRVDSLWQGLDCRGEKGAM
jgi:hypothetical protein